MTDNPTFDPWAFWHAALAGEKPQMSPDSPEWGYYKTREENGPWEPVQIWQDEQGWIASRNGEWLRNFNEAGIVTGRVDALWNWCGRYPISKQEFDERKAGTWEGDDPVVAAAKTNGPALNSEGVSEAEILRDQIDAAIAGIKAYAKITSDEQAGKAQSLRARLLELSGNADKQREKLVRPHLDGQKAVNAIWQPLVKDAKAGADDVRKAMEAYSTEQLRIRREEERRVEQARLAAEKEAREKAEAAGRPDLVETFVDAAVAPLPAPETTVKGTYGRAATKSVEVYVAEITDQDALYRYFEAERSVKECLVALAQKAVKAGNTVPGIRLDERMTVK